MAKQVNQADMLASYKAGMAGGAGKYRAGVGRVTENPATGAIAKVQDGTWAARTTAAAPLMIAKLSQTTLAGWIAAAQAQGATNFAGSATKAGANYAKVLPQLAAAATQASSDAKNANGPLEKVRAAINAMKTAFGKQPI